MIQPTSFYRATVVDNEDPDNRRRVRLKVPHLLGDATTGWVDPMASSGIPAVGVMVWATFEGGDLSYPLYLYV